jgi:hypothetical protein
MLHEGAASLQQLSSAEKPIFIQPQTLYNGERTQYHRFLSVQAKLRKLIAGTVSEAKRSQLRPDKSVREWIKSLQASTQPIDTQMQDMVRARHRVEDSLEAEICLCIGARAFGPSILRLLRLERSYSPERQRKTSASGAGKRTYTAALDSDLHTATFDLCKFILCYLPFVTSIQLSYCHH